MGLGLSTAVWWCLLFGLCAAWTREELEVYDLVEEVGQNFYHFIGVENVTTKLDEFHVTICCRMRVIPKSERLFAQRVFFFIPTRAMHRMLQPNFGIS